MILKVHQNRYNSEKPRLCKFLHQRTCKIDKSTGKGAWKGRPPPDTWHGFYALPQKGPFLWNNLYLEGCLVEEDEYLDSRLNKQNVTM